MVEMHISSGGPVLDLIVNKEMFILRDTNYGHTNISQSAGVGGVKGTPWFSPQ